MFMLMYRLQRICLHSLEMSRIKYYKDVNHVSYYFMFSLLFYAPT